MTNVLPLLAAGGAALLEAIPGVGAFLPGEVTISALGASTQNGALWLIVAATLGACLGDQLNYWAGRALGPRVGSSRLIRRLGVAHWERGTEMIRRHGAKAVMVSRMLPVVRTLAPLAAGTAVMRPLRFSLASVTGCALWATAWVTLGAVFGHLLQTALAFLAAIGVVAGAVMLWMRSRSARRNAISAWRWSPTADAVGEVPATRRRPEGHDPASLVVSQSNGARRTNRDRSNRTDEAIRRPDRC